MNLNSQVEASERENNFTNYLLFYSTNLDQLENRWGFQNFEHIPVFGTFFSYLN